jgi:hypothetical protein
MDGKPMKLTPAQRRDLERLFVCSRAGRRAVYPHATTISMVTSLRRLRDLAQRGLVSYREIPYFYERFRVLGWHCFLTARAQLALERELGMGAS